MDTSNLAELERIMAGWIRDRQYKAVKEQAA